MPFKDQEVASFELEGGRKKVIKKPQDIFEKIISETERRGPTENKSLTFFHGFKLAFAVDQNVVVKKTWLEEELSQIQLNLGELTLNY